jgi:CheY-like chemotaxis protein
MELKKVLLVDDDEGFNFLNRIVFTDNKVSCQVDEVTDGSAALDYLEKTNECPDVILLDINMPVMDGFEFLEQFEKYNKCSSITKVFILTSSQREEDKEKSLGNKYVKGYFDKPLSSAHIQQILDTVNK